MPIPQHRHHVVRTGGLMVAFVAALPAYAGISADLLTVHVQTADARATYTVTTADMNWTPADLDAGQVWQLGEPIMLVDPASARALAELQSAQLYVRGDPELALSFSVLAGDQDISVTIESGSLEFPAMSCARGSASASATLRDDGNNGARLLGRSGPNSDSMVWATLNGEPPDCATFAALIHGIEVPAGIRVASATENWPPSGELLINSDVNTIGLKLQFEISARDCVTGSAAFQVSDASPPRGDLNCDSVTNFEDVTPFVLMLFDPEEYQRQYPGCCGSVAGDMNDDGRVDFNDIDPFVECISNGCS